MPLDEKRVALCLGVLQELLSDYERSKFYLVPPSTALSPEETRAYNALVPPHTHRNLVEIQSWVRERRYATVGDFRDDVELCFENSKRFCKDRYKAVYQCAVVLQKQFRKAYEGMVKNLNSAPKATASSTGGLKIVFKKGGTKAAPSSGGSSSGAADISGPAQLFARMQEILKAISSMAGARMLLQPVDFRAVPDYLLRIAYPMDLSTIARKLSNSATGQDDESYAGCNDFAADVRLVFANFLRYNFHAGPSAKVRKEVTKVLLHFETLWLQFANEVSPLPSNALQLRREFPHLKRCLLAAEAAKREPSCGGKAGTLAVQLFIDPVRVYFASDEQYAAYAAVVADPIDLGTVIARIVLAEYTSLGQVRADVARIASNCEEYWRAAAPPPAAPGAMSIDKIYTTDANSLLRAFLTALEAHAGADDEVRAAKAPTALAPAVAEAAARGGAAKLAVAVSRDLHAPTARPAAPTARGRGGRRRAGESDFSFARVQERADDPKVRQWVKDALRKCLSAMKTHYLRPAAGAAAGRVLTCGPFLRPVDARLFPDYASVVAQPMDMYSIERKVNAERVRFLREALEDFDLIRSNAHLYNIGEAGIEVRIMADAVVAYFRHLLRGLVRELLERDAVFAQGVVCEQVEALLREQDPPSVLDFLADEAAARQRAQPAAKTKRAPAVAAVDQYDQYDYEPAYYEHAAAEEYYEEAAYAGADKDPSVYQRQLSGWEAEAHSVLQKVSKHDLVSLSKGKYVSNFFVPVVEGLAPERAAEYLAAVAQPMDLETLRYELYDGTARSPQEFFKKLVSIFQNAIDFNSKQGSELERSQGLVRRCQHLIKYCTWVAMESFSPHEYETLSRRAMEEAPGEQLLITPELREAARADREAVAVQGSMAISQTECRRLLKDVERCNNKQQKYSLSYFCVPVDERLLADYSVFVKKAVDLRTVRLRLDGPSPSNPLPAISQAPPKYLWCGEFLTDMKLVFENAIAYNRAHLQEDTTGVSRKIYDAAQELQKRLLGLLPAFTLDLADKVLRAQLAASEQQARDALRIKLREAENQEVQSYGQEELERLKRDDEQFARDFDTDFKKSETSLHMKASRIAQHRIESGVLHGSTGIEEYDDDAEAMRLADVIVARAQGFGASYGLAPALLRLDPRDIRGYGGCTQPFFVPLRLLAYLESKRRVYEEARERWLAGAEAAAEGGKRRRVEVAAAGRWEEQQAAGEGAASVLPELGRISISIRRPAGRAALSGLLDL